MDHTKPWLRYIATSSLNDKTLDLDKMKVRNDSEEELGTVDGFVVDSGSGRPRYVVVDAGGWFTAKQFLVPIGEVHLDAARDALRVSLAKDQIRRFPGFDLDEFQPLGADDIDRLNTQRDTFSHPGDTARAFVWTDESFQPPEWWSQRDNQPNGDRPTVTEERMADEQDRSPRGILGDINPAPSARDHMKGSIGQDEAEDEDQEQRAGSRDVTRGTTGNAGTETGGTRNYRTGTGQTGGDIGNRPE